MLIRLLTLLIIMLSTSCGIETQDARVAHGGVSCVGHADTDEGTDSSRNGNFCWIGLANSDAPALRTVGKVRPAERQAEKRKSLLDRQLTIISTNTTLKRIAAARRLCCHIKNRGGSLLHFICKLSL